MKDLIIKTVIEDLELEHIKIVGLSAGEFNRIFKRRDRKVYYDMAEKTFYYVIRNIYKTTEYLSIILMLRQVWQQNVALEKYYYLQYNSRLKAYIYAPNELANKDAEQYLEEFVERMLRTPELKSYFWDHTRCERLSNQWEREYNMRK